MELPPYESLREFVIEAAERVQAHCECVEEEIRMNEGSGSLSIVQRGIVRIGRVLSDLVAGVPFDDGDELAEMLTGGNEVHRLQQQISVLKQRLYERKLEIERQESRRRIAEGTLQRRAEIINYIRKTLYQEVCILRENLTAKTNCSENVDVGVFSLFDFLNIMEPNGGNGGDTSQPTDDPKHQLQELLHRWKSEEAQKIEVQNQLNAAMETLEEFKERCTSLENDMQDLSTRFTNEFLRLNGEKLQSSLDVKSLTETVANLTQTNEELTASIQTQDEVVEDLRDENLKKAEKLKNLERSLEDSTMKFRSQIATLKAVSAVEDRTHYSTLSSSPSGPRKLRVMPHEFNDNPPLLGESDPAYIAEVNSMQTQLTTVKVETAAWRAECIASQIKIDSLEHLLGNFRNHIEKNGLELPGEDTGDDKEATAEPPPAVKIRELKADVNLLTRKVRILVDKYGIILKNYDTEDGEPPRPDHESEEPELTDVMSLVVSLERIDKRLRARVVKDRHKAREVIKSHNIDKARWELERKEWRSRWGHLQGRLPKTVYSIVSKISTGDTKAAEEFKEEQVKIEKLSEQIQDMEKIKAENEVLMKKSSVLPTAKKKRTVYHSRQQRQQQQQRQNLLGEVEGTFYRTSSVVSRQQSTSFADRSPSVLSLGGASFRSEESVEETTITTMRDTITPPTLLTETEHTIMTPLLVVIKKEPVIAPTPSADNSLVATQHLVEKAMTQAVSAGAVAVLNDGSENKKNEIVRQRTLSYEEGEGTNSACITRKDIGTMTQPETTPPGSEITCLTPAPLSATPPPSTSLPLPLPSVPLPPPTQWWKERTVCACCGFSNTMGADDVSADVYLPKWLNVIPRCPSQGQLVPLQSSSPVIPSVDRTPVAVPAPPMKHDVQTVTDSMKRLRNIFPGSNMPQGKSFHGYVPRLLGTLKQPVVGLNEGIRKEMRTVVVSLQQTAVLLNCEVLRAVINTELSRAVEFWMLQSALDGFTEVLRQTVKTVTGESLSVDYSVANSEAAVEMEMPLPLRGIVDYPAAAAAASRELALPSFWVPEVLRHPVTGPVARSQTVFAPVSNMMVKTPSSIPSAPQPIDADHYPKVKVTPSLKSRVQHEFVKAFGLPLSRYKQAAVANQEMGCL